MYTPAFEFTENGVLQLLLLAEVTRALPSTYPGVVAATKKWRDLHDLDCTTKTVVSDQQASKTVSDQPTLTEVQ